MLSPGAAETPTCAVCSQKQSVGSYAALHGKIYCKPHFKQLKETVTKLFGTAQHKHKWGQKLTSAEPSGGDDRKAKKYSEEDQQKQQQQQQPPRSVSDSGYFWKSHVAAPAAAIQSPRRIPLPSTASSHCSPAILTCTPFRLSKQHRDEVVVDIMGRFRPPIASVRPMRPRPSQTAEAKKKSARYLGGCDRGIAVRIYLWQLKLGWHAQAETTERRTAGLAVQHSCQVELNFYFNYFI